MCSLSDTAQSVLSQPPSSLCLNKQICMEIVDENNFLAPPSDTTNILGNDLAGNIHAKYPVKSWDACRAS